MILLSSLGICRGLFCITGGSENSDIDCSNPCTDNTDCDIGQVCSVRSIEVCTDQTAPDTGTCFINRKRRTARLLEVQTRRLGTGSGAKRDWSIEVEEEDTPH